MVGQILDYEAKRIFNSGREEGREEGIVFIAKKMILRGKTFEEISEFTDLSVEYLKKLAQKIIKKSV